MPTQLMENSENDKKNGIIITALERACSTQIDRFLCTYFVIHQNDSDIFMDFKWPRILNQNEKQNEINSNKCLIHFLQFYSNEWVWFELQLNKNNTWLQVEICSRRLAFYAAGKIAMSIWNAPSPLVLDVLVRSFIWLLSIKLSIQAPYNLICYTQITLTRSWLDFVESYDNQFKQFLGKELFEEKPGILMVFQINQDMSINRGKKNGFKAWCCNIKQ